ncbi:MAG: FmdB family transcriptional regulator [Actinobacteria bacterium]|nr:FmdB family transcriptional regulator [Actinomycetota bacterium]
MPTYEYACRDCGEHLEVVQSFKDDALTVCPACDGRLRKVFSAAPIVFKGSGWHIKDYGTPAAKPEASGAKPDAGSSDKSSAASSASSDSTTTDRSKSSGGSSSEEKRTA